MKYGNGVGALELFSWGDLPRASFLRILTLFCFFQFAGLQNGWIKTVSAGPVDVQASIQSLASAAGQIGLSAHPSKINDSINVFRSAFSRWAVSLQAGRAGFQGSESHIDYSATRSAEIASAQPAFSGRQMTAIKEEWKQSEMDKESLSGLRFTGHGLCGTSDQSIFNSMVSNRIRQAAAAAGKINKKKTGPRIVYAANDGADDARIFASAVLSA